MSDADVADADLWLQKLNPAPGIEVPTPASRPVTVADATERLGTGPVEWACQVGYAMTTRIIAEIPEFGGGTEQFESLRMGPESSVIRALIWLSSRAGNLPAITEEALRGDVEFVRRGISLDRVLRGVRLGHAQMAKAFLDSCRELVPEPDQAVQMQLISESLFRYIDDFSGEMASTYMAERERWTISAAAAKAEIVRQILDGSRSDRTEAGRELGYDLSRQHVALTLWFDPVRNSADTPELESAALEALASMGATNSLVMPVGGGKVWAWGSRTSFPPQPTCADYRPAKADIRMAAGTPAADLAGFRRSHREAQAAEQAARLSQPASEWDTHYADVAIASLLSADMALARDLVIRELGPLAENTANAGDLRTTLLCYLQEESSPHAAAQRLFVSRNTVAYRVKRASELLGFDVAERRFELQTALVLAAKFGLRVMSPDTD
ncbi:PucR family transcriptional regulator [Arthrobacter sp. MYb213]|uniref:PucR family transcriptional regulator n=1 Tax=Arthrobacter sp. MYb213 TaxID=1848595 RepID=UPI0015E30AE4|nr:PucR family transcriptional regulator [Arthrobacter sp. MYb213]